MKIDKAIQTFPRFLFGNYGTCGYCGFSEQMQVDHVISFKFISPMQRDLCKGKDMTFGPQMWSCADCNRKISCKYFGSFMERCKHISDIWANLAISVSPEWDQWEVEELNGWLKNRVIYLQNQKKRFYQRAQWFLSDEFFINIEGLLYEERLIPHEDAFHKHYYEFFQSTIERINLRLDSLYKKDH